MALGDPISEWNGKITSVKVQPFESSGWGIKQEINIFANQSGRLSGQETGTIYLQLALDGKSTGSYYGVLVTSGGGETVIIESRGAGVPIGSGRTRFRTTVTFRTISKDLAWLNTIVAAFEGEADQFTIVGKIYEWK